jgi:hypothetical protein
LARLNYYSPIDFNIFSINKVSTYSPEDMILSKAGLAILSKPSFFALGMLEK